MKDELFWKTYFKVYDKLNILIPYQDTLDTITNVADIQKGDHILDLGSGTGNLSVKMTERGAIVTGFDLSVTGINIHKHKQSSVRIVLGDISTRLPFDDNSFDKICSNNVIYTLEPKLRQSIYNELFRIVKPGGCVVISNIAVGFSPFKIYLSHLVQSIRLRGIFRTGFQAIRLMLPTLRIFYYNYLIKKRNGNRSYSFIEVGEQEKMMENACFFIPEPYIRTYANQAILIKGIKHNNHG